MDAERPRRVGIVGRRRRLIASAALCAAGRAGALSAPRGLSAAGLLGAVEEAAPPSALQGCAGFDCVLRYVALPDPHFAWRDTGARISGVDEETAVPWTGRVLNVTSQSWLTKEDLSHPLLWHLVVVVEPQMTIEFPDFAAVNFEFGYYTAGVEGPSGPSPRMGKGQEMHTITNRQAGDDPLSSDAAEVTAENLASQLPLLRDAATGAARAAVRASSMGACVLQLVNGYEVFADDVLSQKRSQDTLKAYTYEEFLRNPSRPEVLLEMAVAKAAVRTLDALAASSGGVIRRFGVFGYSKLGTAAYIAAAADKRVEAIAPGSIYLALGDLAEAPPEVVAATKSPEQPGDAEVQRELEQKFDPEVGAAAAALNKEYFNVISKVRTPEFDALSSIIDPLRWADRLRLPKYIVMSSDDSILTVLPSLKMNTELQQIPGPTSFAQLPNCDHVNTQICAAPYVGAFFRGHLLGRPAPRIEWTGLPENGRSVAGRSVEVSIVADGAAAPPTVLRARLWSSAVSSKTLVSYATFEPQDLRIAGRLVQAGAGPPEGSPAGAVAASFVTVDFEWPEPGFEFRLSTPMWFSS